MKRNFDYQRIYRGIYIQEPRTLPRLLSVIAATLEGTKIEEIKGNTLPK